MRIRKKTQSTLLTLEYKIKTKYEHCTIYEVYKVKKDNTLVYLYETSLTPSQLAYIIERGYYIGEEELD